MAKAKVKGKYIKKFDFTVREGLEADVQIKEFKDGWAWRLIHENGNLIAEPGQRYSSKKEANRMWKKVSFLFWQIECADARG